MNGKISNPSQICCARRVVLTEGKEAGLRVLELDNGVLRVLVNESRAFDLMQMFHRGMNVSFVSKNGFSSKEGAFAKTFEGGMLYTCGLESVGDRPGFPLHGTVHRIPAKLLSVWCDEEEISAVAELEDTALFGRNLRLRREIVTRPGSDTLSVRDRLTNCGTREESFALLYHVNLGYPMLDEGAEVISEPVEVIPRTAAAEARLAERTVFPGCRDNEEEACYFLRHRVPEIAVRNDRVRRQFRLRYSGETLPRFVQWNSPASGDYALGLEPATTWLDDRFRLKTIAPGETVEFALDLCVEDL